MSFEADLAYVASCPASSPYYVQGMTALGRHFTGCLLGKD